MKEGRSIDGTLSLRPRQSRRRSRIDPDPESATQRRYHVAYVATRRRTVLHGAVLGGVILAVASSLAFHGGHAAAHTAHVVSDAVTPAVAAGLTSSTTPLTAANAGSAVQDAALAFPSRAAATAARAAAEPAPILPAAPAAPAANEPASTARLSRSAALIDPAISVHITPPSANKSSLPQSAATTSQDATEAPPSEYLDHTIAVGETLHGIADSYGISVATLEANNQGIDDFNTIHPGQTLRIPTTDGVLYSVRQGDTVGSISSRFGVSSTAILDLAANNLQNADTIRAGQTILVPVEVKDVVPASRPPAPIARPIVVPPSHPVLSPPSRPPAAAASVAHPPAASHPAAPAAPKPAATPAPKPAAPAPPTAIPIVSRFIWPVQGIITQGFGVPELGYGAPHTGIDIAVPVGTAVAAAGNGTVIFAGGDPCCSFGYYVMISHPGGLETLYGHLSRIGVSVGQAVTQGQIIGSSGNTGYSTGPHVHFQVQIGEVPVNPLQYLP